MPTFIKSYVTHVRSVPRRSAFSYWKRKKAGTAGRKNWSGETGNEARASLVPSRPSFFSLPVRKSGTPGNTSHVRDVRFNERGHG